MSIQTQSQTPIDIWRRTSYQDPVSGGILWNFDYIETDNVLWIDNEDSINFDYKQQRPRKAATIITNQSAIYVLITDQNTIVVQHNDPEVIQYKITGRYDIGNRQFVSGINRCFECQAQELLTSIPLPGEVSGGILISGNAEYS